MTPTPATTDTNAARLRDASLVIVGAGALGCAAAEALVDAGIGRLTLIDPDRVECSNLHRQLLHRTADLGRLKVESAAAKLTARAEERRGAPALLVTPVAARVTPANAAALLPGHACVIDATDGIETKFVLNDAAVSLGLPLVHGGVVRFAGQLMTILPGESACYRCLFEAPPAAHDVPSCHEAGILGPIAGTIGTLQAAEAVRIVTGEGSLLQNRLLTYDALAGRWRQVRLQRNPACRACGRRGGLAPGPPGSQQEGRRATSVLREESIMPVQVRIPTPLRKLTGGAESVAANGQTVAAVVQDLESHHPGLKERLCDEAGKVRRFVNVYVNGEDIRFLSSLETPVKDGDEISIVPAIAGGCGRGRAA